MTSSTRTTWTNGQPSASVQTGNIQSVTITARQVQVNRLERQADQRGQSQQRATTTSYYAGSGQYRQLGGSGGYRVRGNTSSGGVRAGQRVPANDGLVGGMPSTLPLERQTKENLDLLADDIARTAYNSGPQIGEPNPNDLAGDDSGKKAYARYPQDHYYQSTTGTLWQWRTSTAGTNDGEWDAISGFNILDDDDPATEEGDFNGQIWINRTSGAAFAWDAEATTPDWISVASGGVNVIVDSGDPNAIEKRTGVLIAGEGNTFYIETVTGRLFIETEEPNITNKGYNWLPTGKASFNEDTVDATDMAFYQGDLLQQSDGAIFIMRNGEWRQQYVCPDCTEEPDAPPSTCNYAYPPPVAPPPGSSWAQFWDDIGWATVIPC